MFLVKTCGTGDDGLWSDVDIFDTRVKAVKRLEKLFLDTLKEQEFDKEDMEYIMDEFKNERVERESDTGYNSCFYDRGHNASFVDINTGTDIFFEIVEQGFNLLLDK